MKKLTLLLFLFVTITLGALAQSKYRPTRMTYGSYLHTLHYRPLSARHIMLNQQIFKSKKIADSLSFQKVYDVHSSRNSLSKTLADLSLSHEETKFLFSIYTGGTPIVFPLVYESDPCLSLMLVSNDSINLAIDKAYIVDATGDDFRFNRDIHRLDTVKCFIDVDGGYSKMIAVVSRHGIQREFEIDGFLYHKILEINNRRTKFKANVTIPIIRIAAERIGNEYELFIKKRVILG